ncbi:MAG: KUP/HAK/KT family potassium transporter [Verrucomicrobiota bacterium]|nr:KUP/HAK/KT family potassium transporter [Verrucomicrobiota bacterium]
MAKRERSDEAPIVAPGDNSGRRHAAKMQSKRRLLVLSLASLGIVFGHISTSPLYSMRECFYGPHAVAPNSITVLGVVSLILSSLILVISIKYLVLSSEPTIAVNIATSFFDPYVVPIAV